MTLEEAMEQIVNLNDQITNLTEQNNTLSQDNETLRNEIENVRTINQRYYNKLIAQEEPINQDTDPDPVPTCEEFAESLKF